MRLNEQITDKSPPKATEAQALLKDVIDQVTSSLAIDPKANQRVSQLGKECDDFFENYYVKPNTKGQIGSIQLNNKLSSIEAEILNFFLLDDSKTKPYLFIDHAGRGKSTILKYINYYLYRHEESLRKRIVPLYISLRDHEATISDLKNSNELHLFIKKIIKEAAYPIVLKYLKSDHINPLEWAYNKFPSSLQGLYSPAKVNNIKDIEDYLAEVAEKKYENLIDLIVGSLCYFSQFETPVVLFLDDADNFDIDIQRALLRYSGELLPLGLRVLVSLRFSSWQAIEAERRDYEPRTSTRIDWSLEQIKSLLKARLKNARQIRLQTKIHDYIDIDMSQEDIINSFVDLLENDHSVEFLVKTSNFNLHSLIRKLSIMPSSWHFNDSFLLREQLIESSTRSKKHGIALWNVYNLVLGSHRGSFKREVSMTKAGILNCFCTGDDKHGSYTFFIRLHILSRLKNNTSEKDSIKLEDLYVEYREVFSSYLGLTKVFNRSIHRLIQAGLILSKSCRPYPDISGVSEHIQDDQVFISDAGCYYLDNLYKKLEYLYFMKDDIDWPDKCDLSAMSYVTVGETATNKYKKTLLALKKLMLLEFDMLNEMRHRLNDLGDGQIARRYVSLFSPNKLSSDKRQILFTKIMLENYLSHIEWVYESRNQNYKSIFSNELNLIQEVFSDFNDAVEAFSI